MNQDQQAIVDAWQAMAGRSGLPPIRLMTKGREAALRQRIADVGAAVLMEAIVAVERSAFCRGENDRGWRADFDFVLQPKSLAKLLEHGYPSRRPTLRNGAAEWLLRQAETGVAIDSESGNLLGGPGGD